MQLITTLNTILDLKHLLKHKFYQMWSRGELSTDILRQYAVQYYHQVKTFPRFISRVHTQCPNIEVRKVLTENLADEEISGKDHGSLWMQFIEGMGATQQQADTAELIPETDFMVNKFYELADRNWQEGLCALYAYEYQVPEVSSSKIAGLKQFYQINDERTLEFFTAHEIYDVEHSQQVAALIEKYVDPDRAKKATEEAAEALWGFLDGMCRVGEIHC